MENFSLICYYEAIKILNVECIKLTAIGTYVLYYFVILSSSVISYFSGLFKSNRLAKWMLISALIIPALIAGFRYNVGVDYENYVNLYHNITQRYYGMTDAILNSRFEPGWIVINYIVKYIFNDVQYVFVISAFLTWLFAFKAIYDNRIRISVGVAVLILLCTLYGVSFNIVRQVLAASVIMLAIKPMIDRKPLKFILTVLFASTFHLTAIIFLPAYWVINSRFRYGNFLKRITMPLLFLGLVIFVQPVFSTLTSFELFSTYSRYNLNFSGFYIRDVLLRIPIIILMLISARKLKAQDNPMHKLIVLFIMGTILTTLASYAPYINRISMFFDVTQVFIVSAIIKAQTDKYVKLLYTYIIFIYYIAYFSYLFIFLGLHGTIPYQWN